MPVTQMRPAQTGLAGLDVVHRRDAPWWRLTRCGGQVDGGVCASVSWASGMPISATVCAAATATCSALGPAMPMSPLAGIISRRAMNRGSSPATSLRAK